MICLRESIDHNRREAVFVAKDDLSKTADAVSSRYARVGHPKVEDRGKMFPSVQGKQIQNRLHDPRHRHAKEEWKAGSPSEIMKIRSGHTTLIVSSYVRESLPVRDSTGGSPLSRGILDG